MPSASQKPGQKPAPFPALSPASSPKSGSKRKLEDEDEPAIPHRKTFRTYAEHQKHHTHYYLDGNILFQIGTTRFKVHRSRLTAESWWFQALLDHYNGTTPEGNEVGKDIEDIVNEADDVGDDPLFFLDAEEGEDLITVDEFAALLTAIYSGIDYVFTPPTIDDIRLLFGASMYYDAKKYFQFADTFLHAFFPKFNQITKEPVLHNAVQAICMGDKYSTDMKEILPRALHDLARASTLALEECLPTEDDEGEKQAGTAAETPTAAVPNPVFAPTNTSVQTTDDQEMADADDQEDDEGDEDQEEDDDDEEEEDTNIIKQISSTHYTRILVLQRYLSTAWDPIVKELMNVTCSKACGFSPKVFPVFDVVTEIRLKYPCDPLLGIQDLLRSSGLSANYCRHMKATANARLASRKALICKNLEEKWTK